MRNLINTIITLVANPSLGHTNNNVRKAPARKRINKAKKNRRSQKAMKVFRALTPKRFLDVKEAKNDWGYDCLEVDGQFVVNANNSSIANGDLIDSQVNLDIVPMVRKPLKGVKVHVKITQKGIDNFNKMVHSISEFRKSLQSSRYGYKRDQDTAEFFAKNYINDQKLYSDLKYKFPLKEEKQFMRHFKSCLNTILKRWDFMDGYPQEGEYYSKEAKNDYRAFLGMFCDVIEDKPELHKTAYYVDCLPQIVATAVAKDGRTITRKADFEFVDFGNYSYDEEYRIEARACDGKFKSLTPAFMNKIVGQLISKVGSKCWEVERQIKEDKRHKLALQVVSGLEYMIKVDENGKTLADERKEMIDFIGDNMTPEMKRDLPGVAKCGSSTFKVTLAGKCWEAKRSVRITFNEEDGGSFSIGEQIPFLDDKKFTKDQLVAWLNAQISIVNLMDPKRVSNAEAKLMAKFEKTKNERLQAIA